MASSLGVPRLNLIQHKPMYIYTYVDPIVPWVQL
jgi:hypothetical protein